MDGSPISNGVLSCREAAAAISAVLLRTEKEVEIMGFQDTFVPLPFTKESSVKEMVEAVNDLEFGSTDCAQPMLWALENQKPFDVFIILTDDETWCGEVHPHEAIKLVYSSSLVKYKNICAAGTNICAAGTLK